MSIIKCVFITQDIRTGVGKSMIFVVAAKPTGWIPWFYRRSLFQQFVKMTRLKKKPGVSMLPFELIIVKAKLISKFS